MDKQLLKAYIRTIVEEEVTATKNTPKLDRSKLAELMGVTYDGNTLRATTNNLPSRLPENTPADADPEVVKAITKDYSAVMKALKLT
jgi:hypothetical protein